MKKAILFAAAAVTLATGAKAQGIKLGVEAGINLSSIHEKIDLGNGSASGSSSMKPGLRAGVIVDLGITSQFSIQPGVFFSQMGGKDKDSSDVKTGYSYIQVPVNAVYNFNVGAGKLFVGIGPYAAYAVHGKVSGDGYSAKVGIGSDANDRLKPMDFGVDAIVGYTSPVGLYVKAGYNLGLANTLPGGTSDFKTSNMGFMFTVGYMFFGMK